GDDPVARIDVPTNVGLTGGCVDGQDEVIIRGVADVGSNLFDSYTVAYRALTDAAYTTIVTSTTPEPAPAVLAAWDANALPEGPYIIQLTVRSRSGLSSTDEAVVWISQEFDTFSTNVSGSGLVGGDVCVNGTVTDESCGPVTITVSVDGETINTISNEEGVTNARLATWDSTSFPDGTYVIQIVADNALEQNQLGGVSYSVIVDNTPPVATLTNLENCARFDQDAQIEIRGNATDANIRDWSIDVLGGPFETWTQINGILQPTDANATGLLAVWDTADLPACSYVLRLTTVDDTIVNCDDRRIARDYATVSVGCPADQNFDGVVTPADFNAWVLNYNSGCGR
ncbi:MAG: hypothetical protein AAFO89_14380, partial [Planctomycetota bacterium]